MISSYRLGDLVLLNLNETEINEILTEHPDSIGSRFILEKRKDYLRDNIETIAEVVLKYIEEISDKLPNDISESTLIHLRLGDVVAGNTWHEKIKRPLSVEHIKSLVSENDKKYVIGNCFFAKTSSSNYEECIVLSNEYLKNVISKLGATHFNSGNADIDLCCGVKSKLFIQGRGFFSKLIVEIRKRLNLPSIETTAHDPIN